MTTRLRSLPPSVLRRCTIISVLVVAIQAKSFGGLIPEHDFQGSAFGTSYSVKFVGGDQSTVNDLNIQVNNLVEEIDQQMSLWRDDSELSRFNANTSDDWFPVSEDTARVVESAITISQQTDGAFDPTVAPLVRLWSFGPEQKPLNVPTEEQISETRQHVGVDKIEVRSSPPALRKSDPAVRLDLNAIAKGDAVDRVAALLHRQMITKYMVEIGGEVRTLGTHNDGRPWSIGIERPVTGIREVQAVVDLRDLSLATSGDYRNYVETDGKRYSHTIDPRTGRPTEHSLASVSVIADDCMTADAWATALIVLGPVEGRRMAEDRGLAAMFVVHKGDGFSTFQTAAFPPTRAAQINTPASNTVSTMLIAAGVFGLAILGMAIGVILSNRRLQGSCGGLNGLKDEQGNPLCEACTRPVAECEQFREQMAAAPPSESS